MAQARDELPADEASETASSQKMSLIGCPYLGLYKDADTSLAYPHQANHCHRLQSPVGVDLAHQSTYCLSDNFARCYLFGQGEELPETDDKQTGRVGLSLAALRASLPTDIGIEPIKARLPSKVELPSIRRQLPAWMSLAMIRAKLPSEFDLPSLKSIVPSSLGLAAVRSKWPDNWNVESLKERASSVVDMSAVKPKLTADLSMAGIESRLRGVNKRTAGMIAMPFVVLLLIFTVVVWWPAAEPEPDAQAMGEAAARETAVAGEVLAGFAPTVTVQPARPTRVLERVEAVQPAGAVAPEGAAEAELVETAPVSLDSTGQLESDPAPAATLEAAAVFEREASDTAVPLENDGESETAVEATVEAGNENAVITEGMPVDDSETSAVSDEGVTIGDGQEAASSEDNEIVRSFSPLPAAAIASIGPNSSASDQENNSGEPPALRIYAGPDRETAVLTQLTEYRPAAILGRDRSADWILIRLGAGVEGWISAVESGVAVVASELPIISADSQSLEFPGVIETDLPNSSPEEEEALTVTGSAVVNTGALNLRAGPGIDYAPLGFVFNQQAVTLFGQYGGEGNLWVLVETSDGQQGWMNSRYLKDIFEE